MLHKTATRMILNSRQNRQKTQNTEKKIFAMQTKMQDLNPY